MANIVKFGGGAGGVGLNIAYGLTAPTDTTKLWVPLETKPDFVEISGDSLQNAIETIETKVAVMPSLRTTAGAAELNGKIYILGGSTGTGSSTATDTIYEYDPATDTIATKSAVLPTKVYAAPAVAINDKIYTFGGSYGSNNATVLDSIYEYDPETDTVVTKTATLASEEYSVLAVAIGGKVYIFGGDSSDLIQEYDPETDTIVTKSAVLPSSTSARYGSAAVIGGKAYLVLPNKGIYEYDPALDVLTAKMTSPPEIDTLCATVAINGKMYLLGGGYSTTTTSWSDIIQEYDPVTNEITTKDVTLPFVLSRAAFAEFNGTAYLFGGASRDDDGNSFIAANILAYTPKAYLGTNHLKLFASVYKSEEYQIVTKIVNSKKAQIKLCFNSAFIGDADGYAMAQPAYVYNEDTAVWQTLDGNNRAGGVSLLGDATLGDMALGNGG